jgi:DNA-binding transcriptional LysR family regulator
MELTPLRYFQAIARHQHLTRAARELGVTQPALSAMLKKLEKHVGTPLVHRSGRGVALTEPGKAFLAHAEEAIRRAEQAVQIAREMAGLQQGHIRVGAGATATGYILPRVIGAMRQVHPGLRFYIREAGSAAVAEAVASGELDLGIVTLPVHTTDDRAVTTRPLIDDDLRLIVPPGHGLAGKRSFRWSDLAGQPVVAFEAGSAVRELIDAAALAAGVELTVVMELRSIEAIRAMVAAGIGVGLVSRFAIPASEGLTCRDSDLKRKLAIIKPAGRRLSPAAEAFEGMLLKAVRSAEK